MFNHHQRKSGEFYIHKEEIKKFKEKIEIKFTNEAW